VQAVAIAADATDAAQVEASFVAAAAQLGQEPSIVVSTVGGGGVASDGSTRNGGTDIEGSPLTQLAHEEPWETTMRILSVTQFSAHHCCKAAARHMIAGGRGGSIIVVGSVMAEFCHATSSAYTTSKCAIRKLGEIMSRELAPEGIRVNVLQPGHIATANETAYMDEEARVSHGRRIPLGRMGRGDEIGEACAFLCSAGASYITGATLTVDGGYGVALDLQAPPDI
jgi:NAD(P)-dependent dehydrogenase (short-subunit alcohol dehydrogenase family)